MAQSSNFRILLADDEPYLRKSVIRRIDELDAGFTVAAEASDGAEAFEILRTESIQVVITDIRMPVMDGLELARRIRETYPDVVVIILTGYADFSYAQEALRQGATDYLLKPIDTDDLEAALSRIRLILERLYPQEADDTISRHGAKESVEIAVSYLNEHYGEDVDIGKLAESLGFTSAYLTKLFNRHIGVSPVKYLTEIRMREAKRLLIDTDYSIKKIGETVGYHDQFYFSKTFRKMNGMNPSAYRKDLKEKE